MHIIRFFVFVKLWLMSTVSFQCRCMHMSGLTGYLHVYNFVSHCRSLHGNCYCCSLLPFCNVQSRTYSDFPFLLVAVFLFRSAAVISVCMLVNPIYLLGSRQSWLLTVLLKIQPIWCTSFPINYLSVNPALCGLMRFLSLLLRLWTVI